jgi:hypothetical protein
MPDGQVEIVFRTTAELEGALAAQRELEKTRGKLVALGESTIEVDEKLARANELIAGAPEALKQTAIAGQEAGHAFEGAAGHAGGLRHVLSLIHHESPLLGEALHAALHPATASLLVMAIAAKTVMDSVHKLQEAIGNTAAFEGFGKSLEEQKRGMEEAEAEAEAFIRKLDEMATAERNLTTEANGAVDAIRAQARAQAEIADAKKGLEIARIDAAEKEGKLSPVAAIEARAHVEERFAKDKLDRENATSKKVLQVREQELKDLSDRLPQMEEELEAKREMRRKLKDPKAIQAQLETLKKNREEAEKVRSEHIKEWEEYTGYGTMPGMSENTRARAMRELVESDTGPIEKMKVLQSQLEGMLPTATKAHAILGEQIKAGESSVMGAQKRISDLQGTLPGLREQTALDVETRGKVYQFGSEARSLQTMTKEQGAVSHAVSGAATAAAGGLDKAQAISKAIEEGGFKHQEELIKEVIDHFAGTQDRMDGQYMELFRQVKMRLDQHERILGNRTQSW